MNQSINIDADAVARAQRYYDDTDADRFYAQVWGGEDIHIGIYEPEAGSIRDASHRTVRRMTEVAGIGADARVADLGSGYGGAARFLAVEHSCRVDCVNISAVQNARNEELNQSAGLAAQIRVLHGNFEAPPLADADYDLVWSQDAFLHSEHRDRIVASAARLLKPGGRLVFTDIMQSAAADPAVIETLLERLQLSSLGSRANYREYANQSGLGELDFIDLSTQLPQHYHRVAMDMASRHDELVAGGNSTYYDQMALGLQRWVDAGQAGHLCWGIQVFERTP